MSLLKPGELITTLNFNKVSVYNTHPVPVVNKDSPREITTLNRGDVGVVVRVDGDFVVVVVKGMIGYLMLAEVIKIG